MTTSLRPIALCIALSLLHAAGVRADEARQMPSNFSLPCTFTAKVQSIVAVQELPVESKLQGYVIDADPTWEILLEVMPHTVKTPFQPGIRRCYVKSVESVFGVAPKEVSGEYEFTYTWNVGLPDKPEFENFKARKK